MRMWKSLANRFVVSLLFTLIVAGSAAAQCRICDPFFRCVDAHPGAMVCIEGPSSCAMVLPCVAGGRRLLDEAGGGGDLTTWTLFDAGSPAGVLRGSRHTGAGMLALGEEARVGDHASRVLGALADAALAHGRDFGIVLVDAAGDGFALSRTVEGAGVRIELREVQGEVPGAVLADEVLGDRDRLLVPVRVEGRDRVLVLQTSSVRGTGLASELSRLRRGLLEAGRHLPQRHEPLLQARAR